MKAEKIIQRAMEENPEFRLVLDMATRVRDVESKEPPRNIGMATDTASIPVNSAHLELPSRPLAY
jgi:hypothetical protein